MPRRKAPAWSSIVATPSSPNSPAGKSSVQPLLSILKSSVLQLLALRLIINMRQPTQREASAAFSLSSCKAMPTLKAIRMSIRMGSAADMTQPLHRAFACDRAFDASS